MKPGLPITIPEQGAKIQIQRTSHTQLKINMKNIFLFYMLFSLGKSREISNFRAAINEEKKANYNEIIDSTSTINGLYKNVKIIPSINEVSFSYKYTYDQKSKIIKVVCMKKIDNSNVGYNIELKDTKGVFNRNNISVGDDYKYITSYFMLDGIKLSLGKVHALNSEDEFLTQVSNIWSRDKSSPTNKLYKPGNKKIFLIRGIDPFCNGHNCADYVVYIVQKEKGKGSLNAVHFEGTNSPYDFNNTKLFYDTDSINPAILLPKNNRAVSSKADLNKYKIYFDGLKR